MRNRSSRRLFPAPLSLFQSAALSLNPHHSVAVSSKIKAVSKRWAARRMAPVASSDPVMYARGRKMSEGLYFAGSLIHCHSVSLILWLVCSVVLRKTSRGSTAGTTGGASAGLAGTGAGFILCARNVAIGNALARRAADLERLSAVACHTCIRRDVGQR